MRFRQFRFAIVFTFVVALECGAAEVRIIQPSNDVIVTSNKIDIRGTGSPDGATVNVKVGSVPFKPIVSLGKWEIRGVSLNEGKSVIVANLAASSHSILVIKPPLELVRRPTRSVFFDWRPGVDSALIEIANKTLSKSIPPERERAYVNKIMELVSKIFAAAYKGVDIVMASSGNPPATIIQIVPESSVDNYFGLTSGSLDCGDEIPTKYITLFVGTFLERITELGKGAKGDVLGWEPMKIDDSLETRAEDIAYALGRTSVHEVGHSLGLVGENACKWMDGCNGSHLCPTFNSTFPFVERYGGGFHIMDGGSDTPPFARIAAHSISIRGPSRKPSIFEPFSSSYLMITHPPK